MHVGSPVQRCAAMLTPPGDVVVRTHERASQHVLSDACAPVLLCWDQQSLMGDHAWRRWQRTLLRARWAWAAVAAWVEVVVAWVEAWDRELAAVVWARAVAQEVSTQAASHAVFH